MNPSHVAMLKCGDRKKFNEWRTQLELRGEVPDFSTADLRRIQLKGYNLRGCDFTNADLRGADLSYSCLRGAILNSAHLEVDPPNKTNKYIEQVTNISHADLRDATVNTVNLNGASLKYANVEGTEFKSIQARGTDFSYVIVNGKTLFNFVAGKKKIEKGFDEDTDFSGVGLPNARLAPAVCSELERNVRRLNWERSFYSKQWIIIKYVVKFYWYLSDYGYSTTRLLGWFLTFSTIFTLLYLSPHFSAPPWMPRCFVQDCPFVCDLDPRSEDDRSNGVEYPACMLIVRAAYFSIVTMTTLGFGDMHAHPNSFWGHVLLTIQVMIGYFLLGALITRLGISFQGSG